MSNPSQALAGTMSYPAETGEAIALALYLDLSREQAARVMHVSLATPRRYLAKPVRNALKRPRQGARWLALLYGDRNGPIPCSKSTVTNVTHHAVPVSRAAIGSPSWSLIARDATSVSRTT